MYKILLIDDHAVVRKGLRAIIEEQFHDESTVDEAGTGHEGIEKLRAQSSDAVVLDIALPDMSGLDVLKRIRAEWPRLPVLILSVYGEDQYGVRMLRAGASGYLAKSSAPENLVAERLFPLRLVPAGTQEFRDSVQMQGKKITSDFPLIVHESRPKAWQQWQRSADIQLPQDVSSLRLDSMIAVARAAERGLGAALVPVQLSESWFRSGNLVPLFSHELTTKDAYYFVCRSDVADQPNVRLLRDWVLQKFDDSS